MKFAGLYESADYSACMLGCPALVAELGGRREWFLNNVGGRIPNASDATCLTTLRHQYRLATSAIHTLFNEQPSAWPEAHIRAWLRWLAGARVTRLTALRLAPGAPSIDGGKLLAAMRALAQGNPEEATGEGAGEKTGEGGKAREEEGQGEGEKGESSFFASTVTDVLPLSLAVAWGVTDSAASKMLQRDRLPCPEAWSWTPGVGSPVLLRFSPDATFGESKATWHELPYVPEGDLALRAARIDSHVLTACRMSRLTLNNPVLQCCPGAECMPAFGTTGTDLARIVEEWNASSQLVSSDVDPCSGAFASGTWAITTGRCALARYAQYVCCRYAKIPVSPMAFAVNDQGLAIVLTARYSPHAAPATERLAFASPTALARLQNILLLKASATVKSMKLDAVWHSREVHERGYLDIVKRGDKRVCHWFDLPVTLLARRGVPATFESAAKDIQAVAPVDISRGEDSIQYIFQ